MEKEILAGVIQGITEWVPISSEALLYILFPQLSLAEIIFLHLSSGLALIFAFKKDIFMLIKRREDLIYFLIVTLFSGLVGLPIYLFLSNVRVEKEVIAIFLLIVALTKMKRIKMKLKKMEEAVLVGIAQGLALLPGISRSGITTAVISLSREESEEILKISYLSFLPVIILASIFLGIKGDFSLNEKTGVSFITTFLVSVGMIKIIMKIAKQLPIPLLLLFFAFCITVC